MDIFTYILIAIAVALFAFPVLFVWTRSVCGIYCALRDWNLSKATKKKASKLICSIDADCPEGYICVNGHCVPA